MKKPSKSPSETRSLVTLLEGKITAAEKLTGKQVDDAHAKSILIALIDPLTRQHTALKQGAEVKYEDLKRVVLDFANRTAGGSIQTTVYALGGEEDDSWAQSWEPPWMYADGDLGALGKGGGACHNYGSYDHWARE